MSCVNSTRGMHSTHFYGFFTLPDSDSDSNSNPKATLHCAEVFTLHGVRFRFQSYLPTTGVGLESESVPESVSRNVNKSLNCEKTSRVNCGFNRTSSALFLSTRFSFSRSCTLAVSCVCRSPVVDSSRVRFSTCIFSEFFSVW